MLPSKTTAFMNLLLFDYNYNCRSTDFNHCRLYQSHRSISNPPPTIIMPSHILTAATVVFVLASVAAGASAAFNFKIAISRTSLGASRMTTR